MMFALYLMLFVIWVAPVENVPPFASNMTSIAIGTNLALKVLSAVAAVLSLTPFHLVKE